MDPGNKVTALRELRQHISTAPLNDHEAFHIAIAGAHEHLGYSKLAIAREFKCPLLTASRWLEGKAAPFASMRRIIFEKLLAKCDDELQTFDPVS